MTFDPGTLRALVFDVQGTAVDFFAPVMRMGEAANAAKGLTLDWAALLSQWRGLYRDGMDAVIAGRRPWTPVAAIYREALDRLLDAGEFGSRFPSAERDEMNAVWSRLDPWPDSVEGLTRLRRRYTLATLSNAGMAAMVANVKRAGLPFDCVLSADLVRSYKPAPVVYRLAVDCLGAAPSEVLMVASHKYDLDAARACGLRTAFVARPMEFGPHGAPDIAPEARFDLNAADFRDLAEQLGC